MTARATTFPTLTSPKYFRPIGFLARLVKFNAIWSERRKLSRLDGHILNDIGRSRDDVKVESARPAWDAPNRWLR